MLFCTDMNLKTFGGIGIDSIASRLLEAQKWFPQTYTGVNPFEWFLHIRSRSKVIQNHLSRIKAEESLSDQAFLIFEAQVDFIVRLKDILIDELIHRMGCIQRSKDGNRQKIENKIRTRWIYKYQDIGKVIESVELSDTDWMVTHGDIEKLIEGTYPFNFELEDSLWLATGLQQQYLLYGY